ncbi:hypothetical protein MESS4_750222 [Mesorhizobium sp. STM 4661]|nr:hypothetical protein MESS4_750222 [Mesorhizobium sp. STM 4661]
MRMAGFMQILGRNGATGRRHPYRVLWYTMLWRTMNLVNQPWNLFLWRGEERRRNG